MRLAGRPCNEGSGHAVPQATMRAATKMFGYAMCFAGVCPSQAMTSVSFGHWHVVGGIGGHHHMTAYLRTQYSSPYRRRSVCQPMNKHATYDDPMLVDAQGLRPTLASPVATDPRGGGTIGGAAFTAPHASLIPRPAIPPIREDACPQAADVRRGSPASSTQR